MLNAKEIVGYLDVDEICGAIEAFRLLGSLELKETWEKE